MILVTGATGTIGREVVKQLVAEGQPVRAFVRDLDRAAAIAAPGVELCEGDLADVSTIEAALLGVEQVFLSSTPDPQQGELQGNVVKAALRASVRHVVKMSIAGAHHAAAMAIARSHARIEQQLQNSRLPSTHLRPWLLMQFFFRYAADIQADDIFSAAAGDGRVSMTDAHDVAAVAVAALTEDGHAGKTYELTGPEAISFADVAASLSDVLGKPVRYGDVSVEAARKSLIEAGIARWYAADLTKMFEAFCAGQAATVTTTVAEVTGHQPRTFQQFARDHATCFRDTASPAS
ncbi:MAG: NAD(P)-dependent oxidoreductase [Dehalococcoidia bacterium]|nr:NAD(P)-dependent oxidoreductase [Dehalococcoidia bacterium]